MVDPYLTVLLIARVCVVVWLHSMFVACLTDQSVVAEPHSPVCALGLIEQVCDVAFLISLSLLTAGLGSVRGVGCWR